MPFHSTWCTPWLTLSRSRQLQFLRAWTLAKSPTCSCSYCALQRRLERGIIWAAFMDLDEDQDSDEDQGSEGSYFDDEGGSEDEECEVSLLEGPTIPDSLTALVACRSRSCAPSPGEAWAPCQHTPST